MGIRTSSSACILIGNSYSEIKGLGEKDSKALRELLSYRPNAQNAYMVSAQYAHKKYMIDTRGLFPTGLLDRVKAFLEVSSIKVNIIDKRLKPSAKVVHGFKIGSVTPYKAQGEALDAALTQGRGIITMPTGTGKSLVIALITARLGLRTLIVVPTIEIKKQLISSFKTMFSDMSSIDIENIDSKALNASGRYDVLIVDEAHHVASRTYQKLNKRVWGGIYYRFFLTATPFRNVTEETLLFEGIAGRVIYQLSYKRAVKEKLIVPIEAYYIDMPKVKNDYYTWAEVYSNLVVHNDMRNMHIGIMLARLNASGIPTLCLVKEVAHGNNITKLTGLPFVHGQDEDSRSYIQNFNTGEIKALIGTTGILGEGVDTRPCEYVLIAGLGKAKSALMQAFGRAVRRYGTKESAKIVIIRDPSHKFTLRHYNLQRRLLIEEYGITPIKLTLA